MEIKNLKIVADRIRKAIKNKEKIILYGDGDLDGISSVIILKEAILNLGGKVEKIYFPNREVEGYGLNQEALNSLGNLAPAVIFLLDCGISNFEKIKLASKIGFEVIIIDHHEPQDKLPEASLIVDPKQNGEEYPFFNFATTGIIFRLALLLLPEIDKNLKNSFLELVALATIADMMPEVQDNKLFIEEGLRSLENTWRPGLKVFFELGQKSTIMSTRMVAQRIISALNTTQNNSQEQEAYSLLTTSDLQLAKDLAEKLLAKSQAKQIKIKEITAEAEERLMENPGSSIIFEGDPTWPLILTGSVASKICNSYQKPTFIFNQQEKESRGATRTPKDISCVKAMMACQNFLETFGGHPQAGGFTVKNENLEQFRECLIKYFTREL